LLLYVSWEAILEVIATHDIDFTSCLANGCIRHLEVMIQFDHHFLKKGLLKLLKVLRDIGLLLSVMVYLEETFFSDPLTASLDLEQELRLPSLGYIVD
jgi:hypothetical protein